jgi:NTE family protein
VALVLGAGGPVGLAFQAGVLAALCEAGWDARHADLVVGTSIGAVTGALLRAGLSPLDLAAQVAGRPLSTEGQELIDHGWSGDPLEIDLHARQTRGAPSSPRLLRSLLRAPGRATLGLAIAAVAPAGTVDTASISEGFDAVLGGRWPDRGLRIVAADLDTGERVVFGDDDPGALDGPGQAIAASCAVPSYFRPVRAAGRRCVDGGAVSHSNIDVVGNDGVDHDHVVAVVPMGVHGWPGRRGWDLPGRWLNAHQARSRLRRLAARGATTTMLAPTRDELEVMGYDAFDVARLPDIVARAHRATSQRLITDDGLLALLSRAGGQPASGTWSVVGTGAGGGGPT